MPSPVIKIDDKHVPLYRIVWIADLPHFCGVDDCPHEGYYEVRVEGDDSLFITQTERDEAVAGMTAWCGDGPEDEKW